MKETVKNIIERVKAGDIEAHFRLLLRMVITDIKIPQLNIAGTVIEAIDNLCGEKTIEVTNIKADNLTEKGQSTSSEKSIIKF